MTVKQEPKTWSNPDIVDEALDESFPASDPPSWTPLHSGPPAITPHPRDLTRSLATPHVRTPAPFSPEEWASITYENKQGAKSIVAIMVTIFLVGLVQGFLEDNPIGCYVMSSTFSNSLRGIGRLSLR
jgi:hypothetical protein